MYRIALGELNLYHSGWPERRDCHEPSCHCTTETIDHIIWECHKARSSWVHWISRWFGRSCTDEEINTLQEALAQRIASPLTPEFLAQAQRCITSWTRGPDDAMQTLWTAWATVTPVLLGRLRNDAIFNSELTSPRDTQAAVWVACIYQAQAIAAAWKKTPTKRVKGWCVGSFLSIMTAVNPAKQIPHLDTWLLRAAFNAQVPSHSGGGWMVYQRQEDGTWQLLQAGSIVFPNQGSSSANAQHVIKNGMEALLQLTTPETTYVRIESFTNPEPRQRSKDNTQATNEPDDYKRLLQQCFSVHWGRPKLQDLKPAVFLAKMRTNTKYDFLKFDPATRTNPLKAYLLRTAQDISTTNSRKDLAAYCISEKGFYRLKVKLK